MKKLAAAFVCILIPFTALSGTQRFSIYPSASAESESRDVSVSGLQLFQADPASQNGSSGVPANPGIQPNPARKPRVHMIELTAANWKPLTRAEKFSLFSHDLLRWDVHASMAFDSGLSFATKDRPYLGNGARGYFTRYGLNAADEADFCFFTAFLFPSVFHQDPRYIPRDGGTTGARLAYALTRVVVARGDFGGSEINRSNMLGTFVATSISSAMYSSYGADVGAAGNFVAFGYNMATEAAFNVLKEFWPDVKRKFHKETPATAAN